MIHEFLANPIDCHVALSTHKHLCLSVQRFVDGFHKGGSLSCSWRSMHHLDIFCPQDFVHCLFLCLVQPRKLHRCEGALLWFLLPCEDVTQIGKSVVLCVYHFIKCMKHSLIRSFVKVKLHPKMVGVLQVYECLGRG